MTWPTILACATILALAFIQNISFSIVSRSRNRNSLKYHLIASVFSNGIWFLTFRELVKADVTLTLFIPYTIGTVAGSLCGARISMWVENAIGATADGHVTPKRDLAAEFDEFRGQLSESIVEKLDGLPTMARYEKNVQDVLELLSKTSVRSCDREGLS